MMGRYDDWSLVPMDVSDKRDCDQYESFVRPLMSSADYITLDEMRTGFDERVLLSWFLYDNDEENGGLVGWCAMMTPSRYGLKGGLSVQMMGNCVDPERRREGMGDYMLSYRLQLAGASEAVMFIAEGNDASEGVARGCGFVKGEVCTKEDGEWNIWRR